MDDKMVAPATTQAHTRAGAADTNSQPQQPDSIVMSPAKWQAVIDALMFYGQWDNHVAGDGNLYYGRPAIHYDVGEQARAALALFGLTEHVHLPLMRPTALELQIMALSNS